MTSSHTPPSDFAGIIDFLQAAERLKHSPRSAWTSAATPESVAAHTWRLSLLAMLVHPRFPEADLSRLLRICIVHDLGEAIGGDIPAPQQQGGSKSGQERDDLLTLIAPLPATSQAEILSLWEEYEGATTLEAKLAKALDKVETILQHNQGDNPPDFDYRFNIAYGRKQTDAIPELAELRAWLDAETERRAVESSSPNATSRD